MFLKNITKIVVCYKNAPCDFLNIAPILSFVHSVRLRALHFINTMLNSEILTCLNLSLSLKFKIFFQYLERCLNAMFVAELRISSEILSVFLNYNPFQIRYAFALFQFLFLEH